MAKKNKLPKKRGSKVLRGVMTALLSLFLVIFLTSFIVGGYFFVNVMKTVNGEAIINLDKEQGRKAMTTVIYANDKSNQPVEYARLHGEQNRMWISLGNMGEPREETGMPLIADAYIALEDKRFWTHHGVDWTRFIAVVTTYEFTQGASTLTQQLIKNITREKDVTAVRKYREILTALNMERNYDKKKILEAYLNELYLGRGCYGVKTGAERYFGKEVRELSIAECAALAAITKAPTKYDPIENLANNRDRQVMCLENMRDQGKITREEFDQAMAEEIEFTPNPTVVTTSQPEQVNNYYVDFIIDTVIHDLYAQKVCDSENDAWKMVYNGGLKIYAAVDMDIQNIMEDVFRKRTTFSDLKGTEKNPINAAMAVMDYEGRVVGIVGGAGAKPGNRSLNRAAQSWRQPGSTIKPLAVYGPAIEKDLIHWSTLTENSAFAWNGKIWPENVDGTHGNGAYVTVQEAIAKSINTVSARTVQYTLKARTAYDYLKTHFGFAKLDDSRDAILEPMSVGSMTFGFSALEECSAYAAFGNGGNYYAPYCYFRVTDNTDTVILENRPKAQIAFSPETAKVMNELLQTVPLNDYYSGNNAKNISKFKRFGKTGTTNDNKDRWFSGGTPYYVGSVWFGYDIPHDLGQMSNPSARIWMEVFNRIHGGLDASKGFPTTTRAVAKSYCTRTGKLAGENCPSTATGWYKTSNIPGECTSSHAPDPEENGGIGSAIEDWINQILGGRNTN